jgi:capsid protein
VFPGDKVSPFTPSRPNSGYGQFVENVLRHIGAGLNIPFELLMKDFSKTNYSSARAALSGSMALLQCTPSMDGDLLGKARL